MECGLPFHRACSQPLDDEHPEVVVDDFQSAQKVESLICLFLFCQLLRGKRPNAPFLYFADVQVNIIIGFLNFLNQLLGLVGHNVYGSFKYGLFLKRLAAGFLYLSLFSGSFFISLLGVRLLLFWLLRLLGGFLIVFGGFGLLLQFFGLRLRHLECVQGVSQLEPAYDKRIVLEVGGGKNDLLLVSLGGRVQVDVLFLQVFKLLDGDKRRPQLDVPHIRLEEVNQKETGHTIIVPLVLDRLVLGLLDRLCDLDLTSLLLRVFFGVFLGFFLGFLLVVLVRIFRVL